MFGKRKCTKMSNTVLLNVLTHERFERDLTAEFVETRHELMHAVLLHRCSLTLGPGHGCGSAAWQTFRGATASAQNHTCAIRKTLETEFRNGHCTIEPTPAVDRSLMDNRARQTDTNTYTAGVSLPAKSILAPTTTIHRRNDQSCCRNRRNDSCLKNKTRGTRT